MKLTLLGCGSAGGTPSVAGGWGRCDPKNPKNRRRRPSVLVEDAGTAILVDTSPDLREQLLDAGVRRLDAVLYTHAHADHLHGIDDLREVNRAMRTGIPVHATADVLDVIRARFGYVFEPLAVDYYYKPVLQPVEITGPFTVGAVPIVPFTQDHGTCKTLGFRFGAMAYSTDVMDLDDAAFAALAGIKLWVVDAFLDKPHETHAWVARVLEWIERVKPARTVLTHMSGALDYEELRRKLPENVEPGYDGMVLEA